MDFEYDVGSGILKPAEVRLTPCRGVGGLEPEWIVLHFTGGDSVSSSLNWFLNPASKVSAHFIVGSGGEVVQCVSLRDVAWHAGVSEWGGRKGLNRYSIGIEMVNPGAIPPANGEHSEFISSSNRRYAYSEILKAAHKNGGGELYWVKYPLVQYEVVRDMCLGLLRAFPGIKGIVGHDDIAPRRKVDPGPAFPLGKLVSDVFGRAGEDGEVELGVVSDVVGDGVVEPSSRSCVVSIQPTDKLNVRVGGGVNYVKLGELSAGEGVEVLREAGGWSCIRYGGGEGWVNSSYLNGVGVG